MFRRSCHCGNLKLSFLPPPYAAPPPIEMKPTIEIVPITADSDDFLLPSLKSLFPAVTSYKVVRTIVQGNAVAYILSLQQQEDTDDHPAPQRSNGATTTPHKVFVKHVDATKYVKTKKSWNDLRRTLMYARTETRFYKDFAPLLRSAGFDAIPHHFAAVYSEDGWVPDDELATGVVVDDKDQTIELLSDKAKPRGGCWCSNALTPTIRIFKTRQ